MLSRKALSAKISSSLSLPPRLDSEFKTIIFYADSLITESIFRSSLPFPAVATLKTASSSTNCL